MGTLRPIESQTHRPSPAVMAGSVFAADVAYLHVSTMLNTSANTTCSNAMADCVHCCVQSCECIAASLCLYRKQKDSSAEENSIRSASCKDQNGRADTHVLYEVFVCILWGRARSYQRCILVSKIQLNRRHRHTLAAASAAAQHVHRDPFSGVTGSGLAERVLF